MDEYFREERRGKKPFRPVSTSGIWDTRYKGKNYLGVQGRVLAVLVMTKSGFVYSSNRKTTHLGLLELFNLSPENVLKTGWRLEGNTEIWR